VKTRVRSLRPESIFGCSIKFPMGFPSLHDAQIRDLLVHEHQLEHMRRGQREEIGFVGSISSRINMEVITIQKQTIKPDADAGSH